MHPLGWYHTVWNEVDGLATGLRGRCKAHLARLQMIEPGVPSGLRLEKVHPEITELKVSWNKQEFRFLFFWHQRTIFIAHFFQKKTRATPQSEIDLAVSRMREIKLERANIVRRTLH